MSSAMHTTCEISQWRVDEQDMLPLEMFIVFVSYKLILLANKIDIWSTPTQALDSRVINSYLKQ